MLTRMSDSPDGNPRRPASEDRPTEGSGVLAGLPRTRPQRASARRVAARAAGQRQASTRKAPVRAASPPAKRATRSDQAPSHRTKQRKPAPNRRRTDERAPRQGFEAEVDSQGLVQPPGGTELLASAAELAGELARSGVTTGARLLKDFLSRLPG
jgi:hypothetical protein